MIGIDSVNVPHADRNRVWQQLADLTITDVLRVKEISLEELPEITQQLLSGTHQGRTLVNVGGQK